MLFHQNYSIDFLILLFYFVTIMNYPLRCLVLFSGWHFCNYVKSLFISYYLTDVTDVTEVVTVIGITSSENTDTVSSQHDCN